ncbi:hypothetical protein BWQ96_03555 [Gracilariopsis chorda]|uniref:DUF6818 domain-containing protein n=1 Tax=Gracilariopsis chorda TaxID=448386 RepID=A0A2V3IC17_9FLOR|nr:hypothetical protein BWQ96_10655 [Gracilariopsis chorda]PXF46729.1 hypothetical protein BWQ96_03555 [Gracilariopsis chorda]|eukprot:PXF39645.1 hypothetical protein BWQ96_10655 [Gracilariopsis chorda]
MQKEGCEGFSGEVTLAQSSELHASGEQATNSASLPPYRTPDQSNMFVNRPSASLERSVGTDVTPVYQRGSHAETIRNIAPRKTVCNPKQRKNSTASPQTVQKKQGGKVTRKGSTGAGRGATFTEPELNSLLDVLETNLLVCGEEWDPVTGLHKVKFPNENRTTDSLRRKFASLYRRNAPTGYPRIPGTVLRAKKIRRNITQRFGLGDDDDSGVEGVFSGDEERQHTEEIVPEDHEFPPTGEIDAVPIVGSDTPSSKIPLFPIVHKRPKRHVREEADIMELFKASLLQDREFRMAERESFQIEREEDRARNMVEAKLRKEQLEEERKARQEERHEARRQRDEDRRNRDSFMQMFMIFRAKGHTDAKKDMKSLLQ